MGKINVSRVLLGGLLAGLVLNVGEYVLNELILADQWAAAMAELGMTEFGAGAIVAFIIITFLYGIVSIWLYASIRPRFGAGIKTAIIAGLAVWVLAWLLISASFISMGLIPAALMVAVTVWGLFEVPIATVAGAWIYRETASG